MLNLTQMFNAACKSFVSYWCVVADALFKALENLSG